MSPRSSRSHKSRPQSRPPRLRLQAEAETEEPDESSSPLDLFHPEEPEEDPSLAEDLEELEESEGPEGEEPMQVPPGQWHVLLYRPDGFPLVAAFDEPQLAARWVVKMTRQASRLGDIAAWRVYVFSGQACDLAGDLPSGEFYIKHGDQYYSAAPYGDENLPPPLLGGATVPSQVSSESDDSQSLVQGDSGLFDDVSEGW